MAKELFIPPAPPRKPTAQPGLCGVVNTPPKWGPRPLAEPSAETSSSVEAAAPSESPAVEPSAPLAQEVAIGLLDPSPYQPRLVITAEAVEQLADNLREVGLNTPVTVRQKGDRFEIIAGETRWRAWKALGHTTIPVTLRALSDKDAAKAVIADNPNKKDLSDYELARSCKTLQDGGYETTVTGLARVLGRSRKDIYRYLTFFSLPNEALHLLNDHPGAVGGTLAEAFADYVHKYPALITEAVKLLCDGRLTQTRALAWLKHRIAEKPARSGSQPVIAGGKQIGVLKQTEKDIRFIPLAGLDMAACRAVVLQALQHLDTAETEGAQSKGGSTTSL